MFEFTESSLMPNSTNGSTSRLHGFEIVADIRIVIGSVFVPSTRSPLASSSST